MATFSEITLSNYEQLVRLAEHSSGFIYRGQSDSSWDLSSSLERAINRYRPLAHSVEPNEYWMLSDFQQKFHLYSDHEPIHNNKFEWLALMQHHGCPTRLLDFSASLYIATYFAVADTTTEAAVWMIDKNKARDRMMEKFTLRYERNNALRDEMNAAHIDLINSLIGARGKIKRKAHLVPLFSTKWSQRLSRQQGVFLAPADLGAYQEPKTFMDNLFATFFDQPQKDAAFEPHDADELLLKLGEPFLDHGIVCIKVNIPLKIQKTIRKHLSMMGINEESLFPGLDGLARSMAERLRT